MNDCSDDHFEPVLVVSRLLHVCSSTEPSVWGDWGQWSKCNATCGPSFQVKRRECIFSGVKNCKGKSELVRSCQTSPCPSRSFFYRYYFSVWCVCCYLGAILIHKKRIIWTDILALLGLISRVLPLDLRWHKNYLRRVWCQKDE